MSEVDSILRAGRKLIEEGILTARHERMAEAMWRQVGRYTGFQVDLRSLADLEPEESFVWRNLARIADEARGE